MSPVAARRGGGRPTWLLVGLAVALVLTAAGAVHFALGGTIRVPFSDPPRYFGLAGGREARAVTGKVALPMSARALRGYSKVAREDLWDAAAGSISVYWMERSRVSEDLCTDVQEILGQVLADDKPAGYVFRKSDFLPPGTRPGMVAGIPAGKRAVRVEVNQVKGLIGLNPGDRFDLIATLAIDPEAGEFTRFGGLYGPQLALEASLSNAEKQATVRVVATNGVVVSGVETRAVPMTASSLTQGMVVRTRPVQEMVIAVDPHEAAPLAEAIAVEADLTCLPRSGRPDDPQDSVTPESKPRSPFARGNGSGPAMSFVEQIGGTQRELVPVPAAGSRP